LSLPKTNLERLKSRPHIICRTLLKRLFPFCIAAEEVHLPGASTSLYLDFFLPSERLGVEVHGQQHFVYCERFHGNMGGFRASLKRDSEKKRLCELNGIKLAILPWDQEENWQQIIRAAYDN